ncbi:MAG: hypothetical protein FWE02_04405 [Defluviitaleaceae bacterium]|nr:hypothetical protein [Defluviitaleaceae bacterium]
MFNLNFIATLFAIIDILIIIVSIAFFLAGFKLIRIIHLMITGFIGFILGSLIGEVLEIELLSYIFGIGLALVFGYFCFMYHKYLKGLTLGILTFALFSYLGIVLFETLSVTLIVASTLTIAIVIVNYLFERVTTVLFTALAGSVLLLERFSSFDFLILLGISLGGAIISSILQFLVLRKWPNYI